MGGYGVSRVRIRSEESKDIHEEHKRMAGAACWLDGTSSGVLLEDQPKSF